MYLARLQDPATGTPGPVQEAPGLFQTFGWVFVLLFIFYFLLIRPERKRQKQRQEMLNQLKKGDKVMTNGGIIGKIVNLQETEVTLEVDQNVRIRFSRTAIGQALTNSEEKAKAGTST